MIKPVVAPELAQRWLIGALVVAALIRGYLLGRYLLHRWSIVGQKQFECFPARYRRAE